ncbi:hypothetical protein SOVF_161990 [Spinacia oleracea]|nr:hypothetical protein SOVF_161990 [Spinacia oleracea]
MPLVYKIVLGNRSFILLNKVCLRSVVQCCCCVASAAVSAVSLSLCAAAALCFLCYALLVLWLNFLCIPDFILDQSNFSHANGILLSLLLTKELKETGHYHNWC